MHDSKEQKPKMKFNKGFMWFILAVVILSADLIFIGGRAYLQPKEIEETNEAEITQSNVSTYHSTDGSFSFEYPDTHYVSEIGEFDASQTTLYIIQNWTEETGPPPPDMVVIVYNDILRTELYTWESFDWLPYFEVVSSFKISDPLK